MLGEALELPDADEVTDGVLLLISDRVGVTVDEAERDKIGVCDIKGEKLLVALDEATADAVTEVVLVAANENVDTLEALVRAEDDDVVDTEDDAEADTVELSGAEAETDPERVEPDEGDVVPVALVVDVDERVGLVD